MSALTDKIAAEHGFRWVGRGRAVGCACGASLTDSASMDERLHTAHVAEVAERAVRDQIAADIETERLHPEDRDHTPADRLYDDALVLAARIAKGEESR